MQIVIGTYIFLLGLMTNIHVSVPPSIRDIWNIWCHLGRSKLMRSLLILIRSGQLGPDPWPNGPNYRSSPGAFLFCGRGGSKTAMRAGKEREKIQAKQAMRLSVLPGFILCQTTYILSIVTDVWAPGHPSCLEALACLNHKNESWTQSSLWFSYRKE